MKKIGLLLLVLVLAMGVLGVGYAHWSGTLDISGTVNTGTFGAELTQNNGIISNAIDDEPVPIVTGGESCLNYATYLTFVDPLKTQDIGHATCALTDEDTDYSDYFPAAKDTITITVTNAYPSYKVWVPVDVHCLGTIPIKVWYEIVSAPASDVCEVGFIRDPALLGMDQATNFSLVGADSEANAIKLHTSWTARALIRIHPVQPGVGVPGAQPDATYNFTITIHYVQAQ